MRYLVENDKDLEMGLNNLKEYMEDTRQEYDKKRKVWKSENKNTIE